MQPIPFEVDHPPAIAHGAPVAWMLLAPIPIILILVGMVLGFRALRDVRLAGGALGGAGAATFAAGLLPAVFIVIACGGGLTLLGEALAPASRSRSEVWLILGCGAGVWLSVLMMRGMYREATGWTPPAAILREASSAPPRSPLATAAIVLTVVGAALTLLILVGPTSRLAYMFDSRNGAMAVDLLVLVAGLICGVAARREPAGRTCGWICGSLFVVLLLLSAA